MKHHLPYRLAAALAAMLTITLPVNLRAQTVQLTSETVSFRYDGSGRKVGEISPDPDGAGPLKYAAVRTVYDAAGLIVRVESGELASWQNSSIAPDAWSGFTILQTEFRTYNTLGQLVRTWVRGYDYTFDTMLSVVETNYDREGRPGCTALRMNPASWYGSPPGGPNLPWAATNACNHNTAGSNGPDRITKNIYDVDGRLLQVRKAVGTANEIADVTMSYTPNGQLKYIVDANGNRAEKRYDGHARQVRWVFPSKARPTTFNTTSPALALASAGALNESDYESYTYDNNGNRLSLRKRDGSPLSYSYDALNRMTLKTVPARPGLAAVHSRNIHYTYDLRGLQTSARFDSTSGPGSISSYDGFGRLTGVLDTIDGKNRTLSFQYDANGNRTKVTYPDSAYFTYEHDGLNRVTALKDQTGTALLTPGYNNRGLTSSLGRYGAAQDNLFSYDLVGRLSGLTITNYSSPVDVSWSFTRNPASQILTEARSNDAYVWDGHENFDVSYITNGLNQYEAAGSKNFCYDANGNLTADGGYVYLYDVENRLVEMRVQTNTSCTALSYAGALRAELLYDPLGRLYYVNDPTGTTGVTTRFLYDGNAMVGEYDNGTTLLHRYVHGSNAEADDPLIWYDGSSVAAADARYLYADPRGSIVLVANASGGQISINSYDEYGVNGSANAGRFQYTGQAWLAELGMYYYKARIYSPRLGRFLQTDPIGYEDQYNLYAYIGNDPVNGVDPTGKETIFIGGGCDGYCRGQEIVKSYAESVGAKFFTHFESLDIMKAVMNANSRGEPVVIIGHSLGGAEALRRSADGYKVDLLVTVDPVGSVGVRTMRKMEDFKGLWVDIRAAERTGESASRGDDIARYGRNVFGETQNSADVPLNTNLSHERFPQMLDEARIPAMACAVDNSSGFCK